MRYTLILFALAFATTAVAGQIEHAPTVEQCQADQRLWLAQLEDKSPLPAFDVLYGWEKEMFACEKVDPPNHNKYYNVGAELDAEEVTRMMHFLARHDLYQKFIDEDAAGKR